MKTKRLLIVSAAVCCAALSAGYLHFENTALQTTAYSVVSEKLPKSFDGYKIAQISDFHNAHSSSLGRRLRDAVYASQPDILVITGDLIDRERTDVDTAIGLVHDLRDTAPIYYVCGNHDAVNAEYEVLVSRLRSEGVHVLENETTVLRRGTEQICLAGIDDPAKDQDWIGNDTLIRAELEQLPLDPQTFTVLLSHRPESLRVYAEQGVDLALTGHAHGGQIRLPFVGGLYVPTQGWFPKLTCGVYAEGETQMVVSRGVGNSGFPFRIQNRPELVVVTLQTINQPETEMRNGT